MKKRTVFNIGALTASNLTVRVLGMFYKMWLAQCLSPVSLGLMQLALSVCAFFITPVASGLPNAVSRLAAKHAGEEKRVLSSSLRLAVPLVLFLCLLLFCGKNLLASLFLHDAGAGNILLCLLPVIAFGSLAALPAGYL
ncbi:MAG: oligosaccharide flippase family protein, partial [Clostridia bacterium]|nr:oligosaccharide flippase family protein [Clostridia bacterium]